jgi:septal ring factor EnvC (AmiA/AmiB activator)
MKTGVKDVSISGSSKDETEMKKILDDYEPRVNDMKSMKSVFDIAPQRHIDLLANTNEKLKKEEKYYNEVKQDIASLKRDIGSLESEIAGTKNKKAKEQLTAEKGAKEIDLQYIMY